MAQSYPNNEEYAFTLVTAEITANGKIYTSITNISGDQPTEEGEIRGTMIRSLKRTAGVMPKGAGSFNFSDLDEFFDFIDDLGDGWRDKIWGLTYVQRHKVSGKTRKIEYIACRCLSEPIDHEEGADGLGGEVNFSFMDHKINGKRPHAA